MQSQDFAATIQTLKLRVKEMLDQRQRLLGDTQTANPSDLWTEILKVFSYLLNLSPEDFKNIRFHSGLITGDFLVATYWHPYPPLVPEEVARSLGYPDLLHDLPEAYWISEPPTPDIPKLLGVPYKGLVINRTVARHQIAIANLHHIGVLQALQASEQKQIVVEIGGGVGELAHHLSRILGKKITYMIVDLPEMFLFQVPFLAVNNPEKSIYLYDEQTFTPEFILHDMNQYDFVVVPNYALEKLKVLQAIALLINMQSFQEMSQTQVREYVEFGAARITHYFYSDNVDKHPYNETDLVSVTASLEQYLDLYPTPTYYEDLFKDTDWRWSWYYKKYFGLPKGSDRIFPTAQVITRHHANDGKLERNKVNVS